MRVDSHSYNHLLYWLSSLGESSLVSVREACRELVPEKGLYSWIGPLSRLGHVEFDQYRCFALESGFMVIQKREDLITGVFCGRRDGFLLDSLKAAFGSAFITKQQDYGPDLWQLTSNETELGPALDKLSVARFYCPTHRLLGSLPCLSLAVQQMKGSFPTGINEQGLVIAWYEANLAGKVFVRHSARQKTLEIESPGPLGLPPTVLDRLLRAVTGRCPTKRDCAWIYSGIHYRHALQVARIMGTILEEI